MNSVHVFDNGVRVYRHQLLDIQLERYRKRNVHEEDEEDLFIQLIGAVPKDGVFLSLGTAIGYYALLAKLLRPDIRIHCFEPLARHRQFFAENIELNGLRATDFAVYPLAVSPRKGRFELVDQSFGSFLKTADPENPDDESLADARQLSRLGEVIASPVADLVQIDIQGLEADILAEYFSAPEPDMRIGMFLIGTHSQTLHARVRDLLVGNGFTVIHDLFETPNQPDGIIAAVRDWQS